MNRALASLAAFALLTFSASIEPAASGPDVTSPSCRAIRKACREAGFAPGPELRRDCFNPIVLGSQEREPSPRTLPSVNAADVSACRGNDAAESMRRGARTVPATAPVGAGLTSEDGGQLVYDAGNRVYWLADANFAASEKGQQIAADSNLPVAKNGMMDYATALKWVKALNKYDKGKGWLGHNNWQLPGTPLKDPTCGAKGHGGASFGGLCSGDALGGLYYTGLHLMLPDNVAPQVDAKVGPFVHMQIAYYWTAAPGGLHGRKVFSFASGQSDATTTFDSYYYVLPMVDQKHGPIGGAVPAACGRGERLAVYDNGPAKDNAVYDCKKGNSWPVDANLARLNPFGLIGDIQGGIPEKVPYPPPRHPTAITPAPYIKDGAMLWDTAANDWIHKMNKSSSSGFLGSQKWQLPASPDELRELFDALKLEPGEKRLKAEGTTGPFQNLQPFFYWEQCIPEPNSGKGSEYCAKGNAPPGKAGNQMNFDFTFGYGIEGTDLAALKYFVMVNYPSSSPLPPLHCTSKITCCIARGGQWNGSQCE